MSEVFDAVKAISQAISATENADLAMKLYQTRDEIVRLQDENRALQNKLVELTERLRRNKDLEYRRGAYYVVMGGGKFDGPVCRECYMGRGLINRLKWNGSHELYCTVCKTAYNPEEAGDYDPPPGVTFL